MQHYAWDTVREETLKEGLTRRVINGEKITIGYMQFAKGAVVPLHHHENEQFSTVVSGQVQFDLEGKKVVLKAGDVLHIPSHVPHYVVSLEDSVAIDIFSPVRQDWLTGQDDYIRQK